MRINSSRQGLTTSELIISIVVASVIVLGIIPLLSGFLRSWSHNIQKTRQITQMQQAANVLTADLTRAVSYLRTPAEPNGGGHPEPSGSWRFSGTGSNARTLILQMPTTNLSYQNPARKLVYTGTTETCGNHTARPVFHTVVYYLHHNTLYRRTILKAPPASAICNGSDIYQESTYQNQAGKPSDLAVLHNADALQVEYFDTATSTTPKASLYSSASTNSSNKAPLEAANIAVTLQSNYPTNGTNSIYSMKIRSSLP